MARRSRPAPVQDKPDLTPMIDIVFQLIAFFVMLMTIAKDEAAQKINLPIAKSAPILKDDQIPDSLNVNLAWLDGAGRNAAVAGFDPTSASPHILMAGLDIAVAADANAAGWADFRSQMRKEAAVQRYRQKEETGEATNKLTTTLIVRTDLDVPYTVFRQVMEVARGTGFTKFQLKAADPEEEQRRG